MWVTFLVQYHIGSILHRVRIQDGNITSQTLYKLRHFNSMCRFCVLNQSLHPKEYEMVGKDR